MCEICYGLGDCPCCGSDDPEQDEEDMDQYLADKADTDNDLKKYDDE